MKYNIALDGVILDLLQQRFPECVFFFWAREPPFLHCVFRRDCKSQADEQTPTLWGRELRFYDSLISNVKRALNFNSISELFTSHPLW